MNPLPIASILPFSSSGTSCRPSREQLSITPRPACHQRRRHRCLSRRPDASHRNSASALNSLVSIINFRLKNMELRSSGTNPLRTGFVNDGQFGLASVEAPFTIFLIPYQISPKLSVRILPYYRVNALDEVIPAPFFGRRRLPIVLSDLGEANEASRLNILIYSSIGLASLTRL